MIKLETKDAYCTCNVNLEEFKKNAATSQDILLNASIEVKGALYTMVVRELPELAMLTGMHPDDIIHVMSVVVGFDEQELKAFIQTIQAQTGGTGEN